MRLVVLGAECMVPLPMLPLYLDQACFDVRELRLLHWIQLLGFSVDALAASLQFANLLLNRNSFHIANCMGVLFPQRLTFEWEVDVLARLWHDDSL